MAFKCKYLYIFKINIDFCFIFCFIFYFSAAHSGHSCVLFENGRILCFGSGDFQSGQLGTVFADVEVVATCTVLKCLALSLASYISFSDNSIPVVDVQAGFSHTCGNLFLFQVFIS